MKMDRSMEPKRQQWIIETQESLEAWLGPKWPFIVAGDGRWGGGPMSGSSTAWWAPRTPRNRRLPDQGNQGLRMAV